VLVVPIVKAVKPFIAVLDRTSPVENGNPVAIITP
jgi:hypothetical protein